MNFQDDPHDKICKHANRLCEENRDELTESSACYFNKQLLIMSISSLKLSIESLPQTTSYDEE